MGLKSSYEQFLSGTPRRCHIINLRRMGLVVLEKKMFKQKYVSDPHVVLEKMFKEKYVSDPDERPHGVKNFL